jgi:hypothetical protein
MPVDTLLDMSKPVNRLRGSALVTKRGAFLAPLKLRWEGTTVQQCYLCRRVHIDDGSENGSWEVRLIARQQVNHGLCPDCLPRERARIERAIREIEAV